MWVGGLLAVLLVVWIATSRGSVSTGPGPLDSFATCLKDKGATFYGAFWCPHCQNQKKLFGKSAKLLPYVECSTPDGKAQLQICIDNKIVSYPTWDFLPSGTATTTELYPGVLQLSELAERTACPLPATTTP